MINRLAEKTLAERETEELLKGRGAASAKEIADTKAVTAGSRARFTSGIPKLAESLASRTGLADPGAAEAVRPFAEDLERTDREAQELRRVREKRDNVNQVFTFMSKRLEEAGLDRTQAEQVAQQFALDEDRRGAITSENERSSELAFKKQDLMDTYADKQVEMARAAQERQRVDAFKNAIYKSIFTSAGVAVGLALAPATGGTSTLLTAGLAGGAAGSTAGGVVVSKSGRRQ